MVQHTNWKHGTCHQPHPYFQLCGLHFMDVCATPTTWVAVERACAEGASFGPGFGRVALPWSPSRSAERSQNLCPKPRNPKNLGKTAPRPQRPYPAWLTHRSRRLRAPGPLSSDKTVWLLPLGALSGAKLGSLWHKPPLRFDLSLSRTPPQRIGHWRPPWPQG